jgi:hypothetical protein
MASLRFALLLLIAAALGCGEDSGPDCAFALDRAALERAAWDPRFTIDGFTGHDGLAPSVYDTARDVDGSLVVAGRFEWIGRDGVEPLMRMTEAGWVPARQDWELEPPAAGFAAIAIAESGLALATNDDFFNGFQGEIWLDAGFGLDVIGSFDGLVRSLEWHRGALWAAGAFEIQSGETSVQNLAVWDGESWSAPPGGAADGPTYELVVDGEELLVGGSFESVGGIASRRVAAFDGKAWASLDMAIEPALAVFGLARGDDGALYAGGSIGAFDSGHGGLARLDGDTWALVGGGVAQFETAGVVTDVLSLDGSIYVTGCFSRAGGPPSEPDTIPALSLARWDGAAWHSLDDGTHPVLAPWFQPIVCGDEGPLAVWDATHQTLAGDGDRVLVGGSFPGAAGVLSQSILVGQGDSWSPQGGGDLGLGGRPDRVEVGGPECAVHVLGSFTHAAGEEVQSSLLRFDGDGWSALAGRLPPELFCRGLVVTGDGTPIAGCSGPGREGGGGGGAILRAVDGTWQRISAADSLGPVLAMAQDSDGRIWVAGGTAGGDGGYLARLLGDEIEMVEEGFDMPVYLLDASGDDLLVAGEFSAVGDVPALRIARRSSGGTWSALGEGLAQFVTALGRDGSRVYVSTLESGGEGGGLLFGLFDGESWTELATAEAGLTPQSYFSFNAIRPIDGGVIAAGSAELDEGGQRGALFWDGERFSAVAGGVRAISVDDLAVAGDAVWFGGGIAEAGDGGDLVPTVGVARLRHSP